MPLLWGSLWLSLVPVVLFVTLWSSQRFPTRSDCCSAQPRQNSIQVLTRPASPSLTTLFPVTLPRSGPSWRTMRRYLQCSATGWDRNQTAPKLPGNWLLGGQRKRVCLCVCLCACERAGERVFNVFMHNCKVNTVYNNRPFIGDRGGGFWCWSKDSCFMFGSEVYVICMNMIII